MDIYFANEFVWTQWSGDPQVDATYAASILGAFTGANFDAVNTLNREFDKQKAEIVILKEELEQIKRQHENMYDEIQVKMLLFMMIYRGRTPLMSLWYRR